MNISKVIGYPFSAAVAASLGVLLVGACAFSFNLADWTDVEGRIVGLLATIAGGAGAAIGLQRALAVRRRVIK
jgi:hypothetical protein